MYPAQERKFYTTSLLHRTRFTVTEERVIVTEESFIVTERRFMFFVYRLVLDAKPQNRCPRETACAIPWGTLNVYAIAQVLERSALHTCRLLCRGTSRGCLENGQSPTCRSILPDVILRTAQRQRPLRACSANRRA